MNEQTKNGVWPYRIRENDRVTYFINLDTAVSYLKTRSRGHIERYELPVWKELGEENESN